LTIEEFENRQADIANCSFLLGSWRDVETRVQTQRARIDRLAGPIGTNEPASSNLRNVAINVQAVWEALWRVKTVNDLRLEGERLDETRVVLDGLGIHLRGTKGPQVDWAGQFDLPIVIPQAIEAPQVPSAELEKDDPSYYASLRKRNALLVTLLAFALALFSGLKQLYLEQPFSTPLHYLNALAWGGGTRLALDAVIAGVGRLPGVGKILGRG
jgi:TM2 domain-containing membrane protein YozV